MSDLILPPELQKEKERQEARFEIDTMLDSIREALKEAGFEPNPPLFLCLVYLGVFNGCQFGFTKEKFYGLVNDAYTAWEKSGGRLHVDEAPTES